MDKASYLGELRFVLSDNRDTEYNESVDCTFSLYGDIEGEALNIEDYWRYCRCFAAAMGFSEETINDWFGNH